MSTVSTFKQGLLQKEKLLGTMVTSFTEPDVMKMLQGAGLDFCIIDCEHSSFSYSQIHHCVSMARAIGFPVMVRVPSAAREPILKCMEMGVGGLLLPNTETAEDARKLVAFSKYAPQGNRGVSMTRSHTDYRGGGTETMQNQNDNSILMCQIESQKGVQNIDEIMAVEGIDVGFVGPNDLTQDMGILNQFDNPLFVSAMHRIRESCQRHNKAFGVHFGSEKHLAPWIAQGATINMVSSDAGLLMKAVSETQKRLR